MVVGCTETERGLGEACLKGQDCTSGVCVAQLCSEAPPLLQGTPVIPIDGSSEASVVTDASDAGAVSDATVDAPGDDDAGDSGGD
jgi:hypothetical protein